jgi:GH24 family phage-related lysozyme (muramidase)
VTYAAGGGLIGYAGEMIKHHEALSSLKPNQNYYVSVKSPEYKKINDNTKIYPYLDSVNVPTIGWGATYYDKISNGKKPVKTTDPPITKKTADNLLTKHLGELIPRAKSQLPLWNKMSSQQQGTIISFLYNAGPNAINPSGPYPKFSKSLIEGNMKEAAAQVDRSGPPKSRINEEKKLLTSGPLDLKKSPAKNPKVESKPKEERKPSGIFGRISSGFNSLFTPPARAKEPRYANGGLAPSQTSSTVKPNSIKPSQISSTVKPNSIKPSQISSTVKPNSIKPSQISSTVKPKNITPLPKPSPIMYNFDVNGNKINNIPNLSQSSTKPPSFSAKHHKGNSVSASVYGIMR